MLYERDVRRFTNRNDDQATKIIRSLQGRHQDVFQDPLQEIFEMSPRRATQLRASDPYARNLWMRALGGGLAELLDLKRPEFLLRKPLYFVTLSSSTFNRTSKVADDPNDPTDFRRPLSEFVYHYQHSFWQRGINSIGMVEPAMFVYCQQLFGAAPIYHYHLHSLVWGVSKSGVEKAVYDFRKRNKAFIKYCTSAKFDVVSPTDFLQMIWYVSKAPRSQHQLHRRATERGATRTKLTE